MVTRYWLERGRSRVGVAAPGVGGGGGSARRLRGRGLSARAVLEPHPRRALPLRRARRRAAPESAARAPRAFTVTAGRRPGRRARSRPRAHCWSSDTRPTPGRGPTAPPSASCSPRRASPSSSRSHNESDAPMPAGLGWHPYFLRTPHTTLTASVERIWLTDAEMLPTELAPSPVTARLAGRRDDRLRAARQRLHRLEPARRDRLAGAGRAPRHDRRAAARTS